MTDFQQVLEAITSDSRYKRNLDWGKARPGHPEGTVRAHIAELERNLDVLRPKISENDCWRLRVLIHTHDIFKGEAKAGARITAPDSHASIARGYLAGFCDDADMLAIVQYHDEPFALWRQSNSRGTFNQDRFAALLRNVGNWNLFLAFAIVDGCTEGKSRDPLRWLFEQVAGKVQSQFTESDIL